MAQGRFSVREAVGASVRFGRANWRRAIGPMLVACAGLITYTVAPLGDPTVTAIPGQAPPALPSSWPLVVGGFMVYLIGALMAEGALFRLALAGEPGVEGPDRIGPFGLQWRALEWRLAAVTGLMAVLQVMLALIGLFVIAALVTGLASGTGPEALGTPEALANALGPVGGQIVLVAIIAVAGLILWVSIRLFTAMAATAAEGRVRFLGSFGVTRGAVWRIVASGILIALPLIVVSLLVGLYGEATGGGPGAVWLEAVVTAISMLFYLPVATGLMAHIYQRLRPSAGAHGTPR